MNLGVFEDWNVNSWGPRAMPESCCKPSEGLQQLLMLSLPAALKGTAVCQSVCNAATITNGPLLSGFLSPRRKVKNLKILTFQKKNGQGDWESLIRPGLSTLWLWETIFEVCTVTVSLCSSQLSLIKLPTGNLMKLETTLKACWSTECWSASCRKHFRSMFWPVVIV